MDFYHIISVEETVVQQYIYIYIYIYKHFHKIFKYIIY